MTSAPDNVHRQNREQDIYDPVEGNSVTAFGGPNPESRKAYYEKSIQDPGKFWGDIASTFTWKKEWSRDNIYSYNFCPSKGPVFCKWFEDGVTNICYNCVDRYVETGHGDRVAFYWEGNDIGEHAVVTYKQLQEQVIALAHVMRKKYGVQKGDVVSVYIPMVPFAPITQLAIARIGAIASVVFGGFSAHALASRLIDSKSKLLITADGTMRGEKPILLKQIADAAVLEAAKEGVDCKCIVYERLAGDHVTLTDGRDTWYHDALKEVGTPEDHIEWCEAEHPLFMLYTSGSTGKPKGLLHTTGGYMVYAYTTFQHVFDYHEGDIFFCTADIGWITGHTYVTFGPLLNRATSVIFEGVPFYPTPSRWWEIIDKYKVTQFYTAPTAIRSLMKCGEEPVKKTSRKSLRVLGSVGEPINKAAWEWYYHVVGEDHCDLVDSWWQTETGGIMITPLPGNTKLKPGSATLPLWGVVPVVLEASTGKPLTDVKTEGLLCIGAPWPGMARTIFGDHERFQQTYFSYEGYYFSGDGCRRDADGYYWLTGRVDDVVNVSGHRLGTSEIECAINTHPAVVESAVVGFPHDIKGEGIYAYVCFKQEVEITHELLTDVKMTIRSLIGPIATPDFVHPAHGLPKTRSGKIMRRVLRKIAMDSDDFGDIQTLADPSVVKELVELKKQWCVAKQK